MSKQSLRHSDHPYYCAEGCYFGSLALCHKTWESWAEFLGVFGGSDTDMNLVWRWDWNKPDGDFPAPETLDLYMMHQRKAYPVSHSIRIAPEDEPEVRKYLEQHWARLCEMWAEVVS